MAGICATVEILALDVVLWTAMAVRAAAAVIISWHMRIGRHAGARTRDAAYGVTADVDVWDYGDIGGGSSG